MALNGSPIWGCAKTTSSHLGVSDWGPSRSGFALNWRCDLRKWECCFLGSLAAAQTQRATTPVDDEKPYLSVADTSGPIQKARNNESRGFHKDLNLLPSEILHNHTSIFFCPTNSFQVQLSL